MQQTKLPAQTVSVLENFLQNSYEVHFQCSPDNRLAPEKFDYHVHEFWELKFSLEDMLLSLHAPETVHCATAPDAVIAVCKTHLQINDIAIYPEQQYLHLLDQQLTTLHNMRTLTGLHRSTKKAADALIAMLLDILQQYSASAARNFIEPGIEKQALDFLLHNYHNSDLSVEDAAEHLKMSVQSLNAILRKTTNKSLRKHLIQIRLVQAEKLLANPEYLIKEVSALTGWHSPYYFCNSFRKYYGVSPQEWRQKNCQKPKNPAALP